MDYLQVFDLNPKTVDGRQWQQIEHRQEVPNRIQTVFFDLMEEPATAKIFVIDDSTHVTMLLVDEY